MKTFLPWILFIAALIGCVVLWNMLNGSEMSRQSAKSVFLEQEKQLHHDLSRRDARILALENDLSSTVAEGVHVFDSLSGQIKRLKSGVVPVRLIKITDTTAVRYQIVRRDSVITVQDTTISKLKTNEERILSQHHEIVSELKSKNALLDSANTSKLNFMVKQSDIIESQDKKISKLQRLSKWLGVSTGVMAIVTTLLIL